MGKPKCAAVDKNGTKCDKLTHLQARLGLICRSCIPTHWEDDFKAIDGSVLKRLHNGKYVPGITDLSCHQETLLRVKALVSSKKKGIVVDEGEVENVLLNLLQTPHWDVDLEICKQGGRKAMPTDILFFQDKQTRSLADTVATLIAIKLEHQKQKDQRNKRHKETIESGLDSRFCKICLPPVGEGGEGKAKCIYAVWSKLRDSKEFSLGCTSCMIQMLLQLSETLHYLSFVQDLGEGNKGYFLLQNPLFDRDSDNEFCNEQVLVWDLNRPKTRFSPAFIVLSGGVKFPPIDDTEAKKRFLGLVSQLDAEKDDYLLSANERNAKKRQSFDREQKEVLAQLGNIPSLTPEEIDQKVKAARSVLKSELSLTDADADPPQSLLGLCNASSSKATMIDGKLSTSLADNEPFRKITEPDSALILDTNGGVPKEGKHFTIVSKFDRKGKGDKFQVLIYNVTGAVDHNIVRIVEERGIKTIQSLASQYPGRIISTEHPQYRHGQKSEKYFLGQAMILLVYDWQRLVMEGKLFLNANAPAFFKRQLMKIFSSLTDPRYWKLSGDDLTLDQRLAKNTLNASLPDLVPALAPAHLEQAIITVPTRQETRKRAKLAEVDLNIQEEDGDEKQRSIPEEIFGKKRLIVSGDIVVNGRKVVERNVLRVKLEKHNSWLHLELRSKFPSSKKIREQAPVYIFVEGKGAKEEKIKLATDNGMTIWSAEELATFLTKYKL